MPDRRAQLRLWLLSLDRFELRLRVKAARARNAFIKDAADGYADNGTVPGWLNEQHRRRLKGELTDHYQAVIPHFGTMALKQIKSRRVERKAAESIFQALMAEWVSREALRKAALIASTDSDDVRDAIEDGLTEGLGTEDIARRIRKVQQLTPYRAATVARTETHAAATYGSIESVRQAERELGVRMTKEWLATSDERTRPEHLAADGQRVGVDERFSVGGELMDRPGDTGASPGMTINCRCALAYAEAE